MSVIVPVYNVEKYLKACMDTLVFQTLEEIEIITINDGSPDNSLEILKSYEERFGNKVKVFTTENKGVSHARNYGLKEASGTYVMFVDSDDYIELNMCEKMYEKAVADQNDIVICARYNVYEGSDGDIKRKAVKTNLMSQNFVLSENKFEMAHISPFPWGKLYKRDLLDGITFSESVRFEDLELVFKVVVKATNIGLLEQPLYNYRKTTQGGFLNSFTEQSLDIIKVFDHLLDYMKDKELWEVFREELVYLCSRHFLYRYPSFFSSNNHGKLGLKLKMIKETQDFLDRNMPEWKSNHYLLYTSGFGKKLSLYTNRRRLIKKVKSFEKNNRFFYKIKAKFSKEVKVWKKRYKKFKKSKNKKALLIKKIPFINKIKHTYASNYVKYYKKLTVNDDIILLESKHGKDLAGNIFSILQELAGESFRNFKVYLRVETEKIDKFKNLLESYEINHVCFVDAKSKKYLELLCSAKYLVTDTSFPPFYVKKPGQVYLNTWHGTPLKAMGRKVPSREYALGNIQRNFLIADYLLYQNTFAETIFLRDYMIDKLYNGTVLVSGYPRNSAFFKTERYRMIRSKLDLDAKQVIVYMPTWRGLLHKKENKEQVKKISNYLFTLDRMLKDSQVFYIKLHPFVKNQINYQHFKHIMEFPQELELYDFLNASDILVTDYSSIMFDYAVSNKKIILFTYDRESYLEGRGMYLDLNQLELPLADTVEDLIYEINNENYGYPKFFTKYCSLDHINCTKEVCEKIFLNKETPTLIVENRTGNLKNNILIYVDRMSSRDKQENLIQFLNGLDTENFNYILSFKAQSFAKSSDVLQRLNEDIIYMPIQAGRNITFSEKIACFLSDRFGIRTSFIRRKIKKFAKREARKNYGNLKFQFVITNETLINLTAMKTGKIQSYHMEGKE